MSVVNRMKRNGLKWQQKVFSQTLLMFSYVSVLQSIEKRVLGRLESSLLAIHDDKINRHLSGNRSFFTKDTRLDDLPRFLLGLFSMIVCTISLTYPKGFQLQCMNRPSVQNNLNMPDASWKHFTYWNRNITVISIYTNVCPESTGKMYDRNTNQKNVFFIYLSSPAEFK